MVVCLLCNCEDLSSGPASKLGMMVLQVPVTLALGRQRQEDWWDMMGVSVVGYKSVLRGWSSSASW